MIKIGSGCSTKGGELLNSPCYRDDTLQIELSVKPSIIIINDCVFPCNASHFPEKCFTRTIGISFRDNGQQYTHMKQDFRLSC